MTPILAFWHRSRKTFVPLTLTDWERRCLRLPGSAVRSLIAAGMVVAEHGTPPIYELTEDGKAFVAAKLEKAMPANLPVKEDA